ncbi:hypothetical protein EV174_002841 [Coemansia sp. RSA 2320]|nr:hypothetical protein EV174_002841 [Coemansia sp. RSA 2320]
MSYVSIYERLEPENILYVSSSCRDVLGYEPEEMVGTSVVNYSCDSHAKHYSCQWPADNPELGVTLLPHNLRHKSGHPVFAHVISINCSGHMFAIVTAYPELGEVHIKESILYKLQYQVDFNSPCGDQQAEDLLCPRYPQVTKDSLRKAHIYTARACRAKACFVLSVLPAQIDDVPQSPTVEFVTNSISSIFDGATDGYEIVGMPFFSLVAPADLTGVGLFMDSLRTVSRPQLCALHLLRYPLTSEAPHGQEAANVVEVELFGAMSNNKIVLLCQKMRSRQKPSQGARDWTASGAEEDGELPYMSLEEIISSDPDSSDIGDLWNELKL